eukprot:m.184716 g.184716  ORF g.184716 m.184716 type:complete len:100 (+) comp39332_c1_seq8:1848-2147(+)
MVLGNSAECFKFVEKILSIRPISFDEWMLAADACRLKGDNDMASVHFSAASAVAESHRARLVLLNARSTSVALLQNFERESAYLKSENTRQRQSHLKVY